MLATALVSPVAGAAALMRNTPVPLFSEVLGLPGNRPRKLDRLALGISWVLLCAIAAEVALGLALDPRYRDFPFAPLGAAAAPFLVLTVLGAAARRRDLAEIVMAAVLGASTLYIAWNEGIANWQSLCLCAVFAAIFIALLRPRAEPSSK
jgi:glucan 1,3-beta-glucosidase